MFYLTNSKKQTKKQRHTTYVWRRKGAKKQRIFSIFTLKKKTKLSIIRFVGVIIVIIYGGIFYNSDNLKEQFWEKANPPSES